MDTKVHKFSKGAADKSKRPRHQSSAFTQGKFTLLLTCSLLFTCTTLTAVAQGLDQNFEQNYVIYVDQIPSLQLVKKTAGTIKYAYTPSESEALAEPPFVVGDIVTGSDGPDGGGYLRRITGLTEKNSLLILQTRKATLTEAFEEGELDVPIEFTPEALDKAGFSLSGSFDLSGRTIYNANGITVTVTRGTITFNPSGWYNAKWSGWSVQYAGAYVQGTLSVNLDVRVTATKSVTVNTGDINALPVVKVPFSIGPVLGTVELSLPFGFSGNVTGTASITSGFNSTSNIALGADYSSGSWRNLSSIGLNCAKHYPTWTVSNTAGMKMYVKPKVAIKLYESVGASLAAIPYLKADARLYPSPKNLTVRAGIDGAVGMSLSVFSVPLAGTSFNWSGPSYLLYSLN